MSGVAMALRPLAAADLDQVLAWRNLPLVRANSRSNAPISYDEHRRWFAHLAQDPQRAAYVVCQNQRAVGVCSYQSVNAERTALSYYLGADRLWPGSGVLLEWLAIEQAFQRLAIAELSAEVLAPNQAPMRLHRLCGFVDHGPQAAPVQRGGATIAVHYFTLSRDQWLAQRAGVRAALPAPVRAAIERSSLWPSQAAKSAPPSSQGAQP